MSEDVMIARSERGRAEDPTSGSRWRPTGGGLVGGLVLALVLIPDFSAWTAHGVFLHHHHG